MVHVHYVLWKSGAPRFDLRAQQLEANAAALRKVGWHAGPQIEVKIDDVIEFFSKYITEWNVNKGADGEELNCHVAERVNQSLPHTASLSEKEMLELLQDENTAAREEYYARAVRTEHMHDFHYPDPLGPPNPSQPCAQLLKGTANMWYCKNGYPREIVCEECNQSVAQDALRPDLWRTVAAQLSSHEFAHASRHNGGAKQHGYGRRVDPQPGGHVLVQILHEALQARWAAERLV